MKLNLDPRDVEALGQIIFAGLTVVACTGRPFPGALPWVERLGLDGPIICYQGAEIRLPDGTKILDRGGTHERAMGVTRFAQEPGLHLPADQWRGVGDGRNDESMIAWAGLGVAVDGSAPEVIAAADRTIPGPGHGGIKQLADMLIGGGR